MIDTLESFKDLVGVGFTESQARALVEVAKVTGDPKPEAPFDTLAVFRKLVAVGFDERKAEGIAVIARDVWISNLPRTA